MVDLPDVRVLKRLEDFNTASHGRLPGLLGIHFTRIEPGRTEAELTVVPAHLAPNGYLHAAVVVALADTASGYGCVASLPEGAQGFTTIELKSNFLGSVTAGRIATVARLRHGGRSTQVWDAEVEADGGRALATFRCTQMVLWPRA